MLVLSLQTLGGSGYLQDYPIEQYVRDAKIDSLYEGTTAIQSLDLLFRKIIRDRGRALGHVVEQIAAFLDEESGNGRLKEERALLATALADVRGMLSTLTGHVAAAGREPARVHRVGQHSVRLLMALGDLLVGWLLLRRAAGRARGAGRRYRRGTGPSTRARSPSPGSSRPPACRC